MLGVGAVLVTDSWINIDREQEQTENQQDTSSQTENVKNKSTTESDTQQNSNIENQNQNQSSLNSHNPLANPIERIDENLQANDSVTDTIMGSLIATSFIKGYTLIANNSAVRLWSGNSGIESIIEDFRKNKAKSIGTMVLAAPVLEETAFRGIPALFGNKDSLLPIRGILSTYAFGKLHQLKTTKKEPTPNEKLVAALLGKEPKPELKVNIDQNKIPVPQYMLGTYYWMVARRNGLSHSMIAHATTNSIAAGFIAYSSATKGDEDTGPIEAVSK